MRPVIPSWIIYRETGCAGMRERRALRIITVDEEGAREGEGGGRGWQGRRGRNREARWSNQILSAKQVHAELPYAAFRRVPAAAANYTP